MPTGDIQGTTVTAAHPFIVYGRRAGLVSTHSSLADAQASLAVQHGKPSARCNPTDARVYAWGREQWVPV